MTEKDPVFERLAALPVEEPSSELAHSLRERALGRLRPRPVHPVWAALIVFSVVGYLGWALRFSSILMSGS